MYSADELFAKYDQQNCRLKPCVVIIIVLITYYLLWTRFITVWELQFTSADGSQVKTNSL